MTALIVVGVLATGLVAGVFFAFSTFVMNGLNDHLPPDHGIAAMNAINKSAPGAVFGMALVGTALICVALAIYGLVHLGDRSSIYLIAGAVLYIAAAIGLTGGYHVPLNNDLMDLDPHAVGAAAQWRDSLHDWTLWNHVRAAGSLAATGLFTAALLA
jgi:uncharacterized membrane protein